MRSSQGHQDGHFSGWTSYRKVGEEIDVPASRSRGWMRAFASCWRQLVLAVAVVLILPYALIVLYVPGFIHPVSTLMLRDLVLLRGYDRQWVSLRRYFAASGAVGDDVARMASSASMRASTGCRCAASSTMRWKANRRAGQHDPDADGQEPVSVERPLLPAQGHGTAFGGRRAISSGANGG